MTTRSSAPPLAATVLPIEIGSLNTSEKGETHFFGSSSGVFFVNTVLQAFSKSCSRSEAQSSHAQDTDALEQPSIENCIAEQEGDSDMRAESIRTTRDARVTMSYGIADDGLGQPPPREIAHQLIMSYFESWHPLWPFLHGPSFLAEVESFYADDHTPMSNSLQVGENTKRAVLFQSVFNIADIGRAHRLLPDESRIESTSSIMSILGLVASTHDTPSLQALLAAQLYLIGSMSLQAASTVGGMLVRNIFHAGFHRCPTRYVQLQQHSCEMRKRIFWSVYITDRYLSQALGHPPGIQDSDTDVCIPGTRELHYPVQRNIRSKSSMTEENDVLLHLPVGHPSQDVISSPERARIGLEVMVRHFN